MNDIGESAECDCGVWGDLTETMGEGETYADGVRIVIGE